MILNAAYPDASYVNQAHYYRSENKIILDAGFFEDLLTGKIPRDLKEWWFECKVNAKFTKKNPECDDARD